MDTSKKFCIILTPDDLSQSNIKATVKTIEHNSNKFYLLQAGWNTDLCYNIEAMGEVSDDNTLLTRTRIAYDLKFTLPTELITGDSNLTKGKTVNYLSDLLDLLDFDDNLMLNRDDYHVVIDDGGIDNSDDDNNEASKAVAKLFQQLIFLNLTFDIQKKSEIRKSLIKDRFRAKYKELRAEIEIDQKFIGEKLKGNLSTESKERAQKIIDSFGVMLTEFEKAKDRPLRIAAMGTKKAGKSVVINSLLKRDYAPTSSTLPTPNTIKYIPIDPNKPITLEYKNDSYTFRTDSDISNFIGDEFKAAQKITGEGAGLPDMTIYYPSDDLNGYEIWDTPGPNVAFTDEHRKNAEQCIKEVDVCIFVMNYSNHLTNDEVNFLSSIHEIFKGNNKFYSLLITVNRIDERYAVAEEKSVPRILDYIGGRLEKLPKPYKNIVIFGTSALQSFYLDKVLDLVKADRKDDGEDVNALPLLNVDSIRPLKRSHKDSVTQIKFIGDAMGNLEDFHGIDNPTEKELYAMSGVPQLLHYVKYIGSTKADMEIVNSVVGKCETEFAVVNNSLLVTDLMKLTDDDKKRLIELGRLVEDLRKKVDQVIEGLRPLTGNDKSREAVRSIRANINGITRTAETNAVTRSKQILRDSRLTESDVKAVKNGTHPANIATLNDNIGKMVFNINKSSAEQLEQTKKRLCDTHISDVEKGIQSAQTKISEETEKVKAQVTNAKARNILASFKVPEFPSSIDRLMTGAKNIGVNLDSRTLSAAANAAKWTEWHTETWTEMQAREASGIWENIRSFFGKTYYEEVKKSKNVGKDRYDVEKFKTTITYELENRIRSAVDDTHDKMESDITTEIEKIFYNVRNQCIDIGKGYAELYRNLESDIKMATDETDKHKQALERDIATFNDIKAKLQPFFAMWDEILHKD